MKFNWGTGIFIFFVLFVSTAVGFMIFAFSQDINLVHEQYYEKGVDYTAHMKALERSAKYVDKINVTQNQTELVVRLPENLMYDEGVMFFYRPSSKNFDQTYELKTRKTDHVFPLGKFKHGKYILKIEWKYNNEEYYVEKDFFVN